MDGVHIYLNRGGHGSIRKNRGVNRRGRRRSSEEEEEEDAVETRVYIPSFGRMDIAHPNTFLEFYRMYKTKNFKTIENST
uniref:Uncharacterized protein n=1 Tax=Caenorhabditis tropicalis TaxID=1561998 RepID=A0A1I7U5D8_9PELO